MVIDLKNMLLFFNVKQQHSSCVRFLFSFQFGSVNCQTTGARIMEFCMKYFLYVNSHKHGSGAEF